MNVDPPQVDDAIINGALVVTMFGSSARVMAVIVTAMTVAPNQIILVLPTVAAHICSQKEHSCLWMTPLSLGSCSYKIS